MHHIYHTETFVVRSAPVGEDSKTLFLYTKELGLVRARAQGVRKLTSKLRYILQDGAHAQVDLVRGKEIWRIGSAAPFDHVHMETKESIATRTRVHALLVRLCAGEEANEDIFSALTRMEDLLLRVNKKEEYRTVELISVMRILTALGYLAQDNNLTDEDSFVSAVASDVARQHRMIQTINSALQASQL